jgi:membrane protein YdbS with pleckstrin-like domain
MDDESLEHITRLHAVVLLAPAMIVSALAGTLSILSDIPIAWYVVAFFLFLASMKLLDRLVLYLSSEFAVTSKRVLGKTGLVRLNTVDIVLAKVEAIRINQGILGRIFDFGDVLVTGTGGTVEVLSYIPDPVEFSKCIQEQLSIQERGHAEGESA